MNKLPEQSCRAIRGVDQRGRVRARCTDGGWERRWVQPSTPFSDWTQALQKYMHRHIKIPFSLRSLAPHQQILNQQCLAVEMDPCKLDCIGLPHQDTPLPVLEQDC